MKKIFTLLLCCASLSVSAQYQIPNSDFELWDTETYDSKTCDAPIGWNSFLSGSGGLKSSAAFVLLYKSEETRPNSPGGYSAKITAKNVVFAYAQGNLTTGRINMGSTTANNSGKSASANNSGRGNEKIWGGQTGNYNWTDITDTTYNAEFKGFPDAMHVWVKFYSSNSSYRAKVTTVLHTNGYYQDPLPTTDDCDGDLVGSATNTTIAPDANNWQELTIPFTYPSGTATRPSYALVTLSTNAVPGTGTDDDYMLIDDLEYIYYSSLSDLKFNGITISDFAKDKYDYAIEGAYTEGCIEFTKDCVGGSAVGTWNSSTKTYTIVVEGDDYKSNNSNTHTYTIKFYDLIIKDGETNLNEIENGSGKKVLLKRTFKAGWNTICLPFKSNNTHWGGSSVKFYTLNSNTDGVLSFTKASAPYDKNVPYLAYLPNEINGIEFTSRTIEVDENSATTTAGDWTFTGSYEPSINMEGKWGVVNDGSKVRKGGTGSTLKSTRAYLEYNGTANVNEMRIIIDGEETTITEIDGMPVGNFDVYNLQGVRVRQNVNNLDGLNKGIYIVNGKKHIVK